MQSGPKTPSVEAMAAVTCNDVGAGGFASRRTWPSARPWQASVRRRPGIRPRIAPRPRLLHPAVCIHHPLLPRCCSTGKGRCRPLRRRRALPADPAQRLIRRAVGYHPGDGEITRQSGDLGREADSAGDGHAGSSGALDQRCGPRPPARPRKPRRRRRPCRLVDQLARAGSGRPVPEPAQLRALSGTARRRVA